MRAFAMMLDDRGYTMNRRTFVELDLLKDFYDSTGDHLDLIESKDLDNAFEDDSYDALIVTTSGFTPAHSYETSPTIAKMRRFGGEIIVFYDDQNLTGKISKLMSCLGRKAWLLAPNGYDDEIFRRAPNLKDRFYGTLSITPIFSVGRRMKRDFIRNPKTFDSKIHDLDFFYGGSIRPGFVPRFREVFSTTDPDKIGSYGSFGRAFEIEDVRGGRSKTLSKEDLCRQTSRARFSFLPADPGKNYLTSKAFENGFSESLCVLEDVPEDQGRYNDSVIGHPFYTSEYDAESIKKLLSMDEEERKDRVRQQRLRLLDVDYDGLIMGDQLTMKRRMGMD